MEQNEFKVRHHLIPMTILWWWSQGALIEGNTRKGVRDFKVAKLFWEGDERNVFVKDVVRAEKLIIKNYYSSKDNKDEFENKLSKLEWHVSQAFTYFNNLHGTNGINKHEFLKHARKLLIYGTIKKATSPIVKLKDWEFNQEYSEKYNDHFNKTLERLEKAMEFVNYKSITVVVNATSDPLFNNVDCSIHFNQESFGKVIIPLSPERYLLLEKEDPDKARASKASNFALMWKILRNDTRGLKTLRDVNLWSLIYSTETFAVAPLYFSNEQFYFYEALILKYMNSPKNMNRANHAINNPISIDPQQSINAYNAILELVELMDKINKQINN